MSSSEFKLPESACTAVRLAYADFQFQAADSETKERLERFAGYSVYPDHKSFFPLFNAMRRKLPAKYLMLNIDVLHPETGEPIVLTDDNEWPLLVEGAPGKKWKAPLMQAMQTTDVKRHFYSMKPTTVGQGGNEICASIRMMGYTEAHGVDVFIVVAEFVDEKNVVQFRSAFPLKVKKWVKGSTKVSTCHVPLLSTRN